MLQAAVEELVKERFLLRQDTEAYLQAAQSLKWPPKPIIEYPFWDIEGSEGEEGLLEAIDSRVDWVRLLTLPLSDGLLSLKLCGVIELFVPRRFQALKKGLVEVIVDLHRHVNTVAKPGYNRIERFSYSIGQETFLDGASSGFLVCLV